MKNFIKQKPVLTYFILTFIISWSGVIVMSFFMGMPTTSKQFEEVGPLALIPFLLGPTIVSLILTGLIHGKAGFNELKSRFLRWRMNIGWYAFAVFMLPLLLSIILLILSQFSSDFIPKIITENNKINLILMGVASGLIGGGLFEEMGWTGFATPKLRSRYSIFKTGLIIGTLWGAWHFLPVFWGCGDVNGKLDWALLLPGLFFHYAGLIPYRILLIWLHERTNSLIPVMLMHASLTANAFFILNISKNGYPLFIYYLFLAIALWIVVGIIFSQKKWVILKSLHMKKKI
jgi:membrane protease YdiL (CAAX protease family)